MTFFGEFRQDGLSIVFVLLSLLNVYYGWRVGWTLWQQRAAVRQEPLQPGYKRLLDQAAFFVAIPPGVFIHELFHALAVIAFGGRVVDVGYAFYFGYVAHVGPSDPQEVWLVAMAGTIGTLLYALGLYFLWRRHRLSAYRFFALRSLRVHIYYALIFYPLFSAFTFIGDWRTIYGFGLTTSLSGATLVVHLAVLALFWRADRRGFFEMAAFASPEQQGRFGELEARAAANPQDLQLRLQLVEAYRQAGLRGQATAQLRQFLEHNPNSAQAHLQMALLEAQDQRRIPKKAYREAQEALRLGLGAPVATAYAYQLVGQHEMEMERVREAASHFRQGLEAARSADQPALTAQLDYLCAVAHRRLGEYDLAHRHASEAIRQAREIGSEQAEAHYKLELQTIEGHTGHSFGGPLKRR